MKLTSTIKKCLGLLYVSALGFSVIGMNKVTQVKAVEEYDTGIGMTGSWSLESNPGTNQYELCFTETGNQTGVQYFFNATSATYYVLSETADIICSVYWINNGNNEDLQGVTAEIHLDNVSEPQINAANGTYPISGDFPNDSVSGVSFNVGINNYTRSADGSDQHLSSSSDEGYWDYDDSDHVLTWIDPSQQTLYDLDSVTYSVLNHVATLTYTDINEVGDPKYVELTEASYEDENYFTVSGWTVLNSTSTEVTINYGALSIQFVDQWAYENSTLVWVNSSGATLDVATLDVYSASFYEQNNTLEAEYLYDVSVLPKIYLNQATYELTSGPNGNVYNVTGYSSATEGNQYTLVFAENVLTIVPPYTGWKFDPQNYTFVYYVSGVAQTSQYVTNSGVYISYGDYYDYAELLFSYTYNNESFQDKLTIEKASYREPTGQVQYYTITGEWNDGEVEVHVSDLEVQFQSRWSNDGESNYFTYWNDLDDECGGTIERVIYNNYGYESVYNECYITIAAYSNDISQEFICRNTLVIYSALIEVDPRVSQDGGMIGGYWTELGHEEKEVHIHVDNIDIENTVVECWNYMNGFDDFIYQTPQGENCAVYVTSAVFDGRDENNATCTFNYTYESREDGTHTGSFVMKDATIEQEQTGNEQGIISGVWSDFSEDTITVRTPILTMNEDPYWTYNDGYLQYIDPTNPDIETVMVSCIYYIDDECFELDYNLVNNRDGGYDTATIILVNAELGRDYNPDAEEPAERSGYISGNCSIIGDTNNYITLIVDVTIQKREPDPEPPFWSYSDGYLLYIDPSNENIELTMVSCVFYTEESRFDLEYKIEDKVTNEFTIATVTLLNGEIGRDYDPTGEEPAQRSGYISGNCSVLDEEENYITLIVDMTIQKVTPEVPPIVTEPAWVYNDDALALWWSDPAHQEYETELEEAYYYERTHSVTFLYSIVTYKVVGQDPDQPTSEPLEQEKVRAVIFQKNAHMNDIEYEDDLEAFVTVTGTCVECEDATKLVVPREKFIIATYDDDPGTITPDQQVDIKELLPEETSVDGQRMEESIVAISSETAHEIIATVNDAHEQNDAAFAAGEITEEVYIENKGIIQTVTEASVVVGAGAITASDEGKAVDDALPDDHDLDEPMTKTLDDFYQLQMDYLLGKKKAPDKQDNRVIYRTGEPQQASIDLTISKEDYAKMIDFVDTAVSNMKDAALKIRKCSSAKMKMVVKDYISVVKVSSFREFDEKVANAEYVEAIYKATMLNMQQQVIEALKREHKPSNNAERERQYQEQLAACEDYDTFEQIVIEVLRLKYDSIEGEKLAYKDANDFFENIYMPIFKSWALDDPSINPTNITLEELTKATIETTTSKASKMTFRADVSKEESTFLIILGASLGAACVAGITLPIVFRKRRRGLAK